MGMGRLARGGASALLLVVAWTRPSEGGGLLSIPPCLPGGGNGSLHGHTSCTQTIRGNVTVIGCLSPLASNYDPRARIDSGGCTYAVEGCTDSRALNFNPTATRASGHCIMPRSGCRARTALNFDSRANIHDQASCVLPPRARLPRRRGCRLSEARNYDPLAEEDSGDCMFTPRTATTRTIKRRNGGVAAQRKAPIAGCMDPAADNFVPHATAHDPQCRYAVRGCTDSAAVNFNPLATVGDNSCVQWQPGCAPSAGNGTSSACLRALRHGCTRRWALNFDERAQIDDGSCVARREGCTDERADNYDPMANVAVRGGAR